MGRGMMGWVLLSAIYASTSYANVGSVDTRVGYYSVSGEAQWSRLTRISVDEGPLPIGGRVIYETYNGLGFSGALNNWRVGAQMFKNFSLGELTVTPYAGASLNTTALLTNSLAFDGGLTLGYELWEGVKSHVGLDSIVFSDGTNLEYSGGVEFPTFFLPWFSVSIAYTGLYTNQTNYPGAGITVGARF